MVALTSILMLMISSLVAVVSLPGVILELMHQSQKMQQVSRSMMSSPDYHFASFTHDFQLNLEMI